VSEPSLHKYPTARRSGSRQACKRLDIRGKVRDISPSQGRSERESATGRLLSAYREGGDARARDRLVQLYMPLVEAFAHRYGHRGAEYEDLVQVGSIGLLGAIERFDPKRGEEFTAFAVPTIAGEIKRHLRDRGGPVRLPRRLQEAASRLAGARAELTARLGRSPGSAELAAELGVTAAELELLDQSRRPDGERPERTETGDELDDRILLSDAFRALDETERSIVYLRYVRELSRRETAKQLDMSEDRLRTLTKSALTKLRGELEGRAFPAPPRESAPTEPPAEADEPPPAEPPPEQPSSRHSGRVLVRMTPALHDELANAAERERISLNQFITNALSSAVGDAPRSRTPRWLPAAIVTNIVILAATGIVALVLLVVALNEGW
jgi:RNA polymerase sigma-B factor